MFCSSLLRILGLLSLILAKISCSKVSIDVISPETAKLLLQTSQTDLVLGDAVKIVVTLSANLTSPVLIKPNYEWNSPLLNCVHCQPQLLQLTSQSITFEWTCQEPGAMAIFFTVQQQVTNSSFEVVESEPQLEQRPWVDPAHLDIRDAFVQLHIGRSALLHQISWFFGWGYFLVWILSMYPQCIVNFNRKSVVGLNFDYVSLCLVGYAAYAIFNVCFTWVPMFGEEYAKLNPHSNIPVQINDVLFSLHGVAATTVLAIQCCIYERGDQKISTRTQGILLSVYSPAIILSLLLVCSQLQPLAYIYFFSYVKMVLTILKYVPQVIFNYRRKSTAGWSIHNILLDFTGGALSIGQMSCLAINFADPNYFTYNIAKLGIGMTTLVFDSIFIIQHYFLYNHRHSYEDEERSSQGSGESNDSEEQLTVITTHHRPSPPIKGHHHHHQLQLSACNGCCMCIQNSQSKIGRALNVQFPRQSFDSVCPLSLSKQLQLKVDRKSDDLPNV